MCNVKRIACPLLNEIRIYSPCRCVPRAFCEQPHIDANNILAQQQHGFRTKLTTDMTTFNLINNILLALNTKLAVGELFCKFMTAFDCVNHEVSLAKLEL
jgi:hypothetical protein